MFAEVFVEPGEIATTSRLQAWWLSKFKGYRVKIVKKSLKPGSLGGFRKMTQWVLTPRNKEKPAKDKRSSD